MSKFPIKSVLNKISEQVFALNDYRIAQQLIVDRLNETDVKDKYKMINEIWQCKNITGVHRYFTNALLKYEGLGTSRY